MELPQDTLMGVGATHVETLLESIGENTRQNPALVSVRGSRLYGLANTKSDFDYFAVVFEDFDKSKKSSIQVFKNDIDIVIMSLGTWVISCSSGSPESLEAMFSNKVVVDNISALRNSYRAVNFVDKYVRTITAFSYMQTTKSKRHALRLSLNLADLRRYGRFNPSLNDNQIDFVTNVAQKDSDAVYAYAMNTGLDIGA